IFTRTDNQSGQLSDTNWTQVSATVPWNYSGQQLYFAFHHNANDMFLLYLDDIRVTEGNSAASLEDNAQVTLLSAYPNPFRVNTNIAFELKNTSEVILQMFDLSGKLVMQRNAGTMTSGLNRIEVDGTALPSGVYYYTLTINGETTSAHKIVKM
ncbi:MAG: T9SS type A sorting domain-containing protein, partial [Flavobacteriales bacterium]|nr:T9SS type A sorting domain-containing protein [Flavobacteriales bacterium]